MADVTLPPGTLVTEIDSLVGSKVARVGTDGDSIDAILPTVVAEPTRASSVGQILGWASDRGVSVSVRGGGTKSGWGGPPVPIDVLLSTRAMNRVEAHRYSDLTATVQAGATLSKTNAVLAEHRQWLPLDPNNDEQATIGGIVATNDSGPRRHRHGAPRDLIIGMTLARVDGVIAKSGGIVVKNVAGYDLARLLTGSFGCLGVILSATFKLAPLAEASRTVLVECPKVDVCARYTADLIAHASTPTALEVAVPQVKMLVRFESVETVVLDEANRAAALAEKAGATATVLVGDDELEAWRTHQAQVFVAGHTIVKLTVMPSELVSTLTWLEEEVRVRRLDYGLIGRAGLGVCYLRLQGAIAEQVSLILALRDRLPVGRGSAVIRQANLELKKLIDTWGPIGDGFRIMRAVKQKFDPTGMLNPSHGPGGL